ncbi:putative aflatoxin biosynthesis ketoreductase nor-1 [Diaporthe ampelina]|uniref:Putative aflatoxin biosynthesis ketoreductase nor-1 n=1 Tax=Diaporthe ampelina TaxID=1214573 RepID=A0A0G2FA41_9PEZI|nr:putative aflatoxin biosynthesis ketoreductase nor-1 [Diaporthe ampelina]
MSPDTIFVLVTGANRGIGRGIAEVLLSRPNHVVVAAVRNLDTSLRHYEPAEGSKLVVVKIDNTSSTDPPEAVETIKAAGITRLDIVIANAGLAAKAPYHRVEDIELEQWRNLFEVNTFSFVPLFRAVRPFLKATADQKGEGTAKLLVISSNAGQIATGMEPLANVLVANYGSSKAALNYLVRRTHFENPWLTSWAVNPGFVQTDSGNALAKDFGMAEAPHTVQQSAAGILETVNKATRPETSGKFFMFDGTELTF